MKKLLSAILLVLLFSGCADTINNFNPADAEIKIEITKPLTNDSIGYRGEKIEYELKSSQGINFIEVYVNNVFIQNFAPVNNQNPVIYFGVDSTLVGQKVSIHLIYYDKNGKSTSSNNVSVFVTGDRSLPTKPFNVNIVRISSSTLNISWQDTSRYMIEYEIWRKEGDNGNFIKHAAASADARNINDNNLASNIIYYYKIRGHSKNGYSEFSDVKSNEGSGGTAPSNLIAWVKDFKVIQLSWEDKSTDENYFKIERRREWSFYETIGYAEKNNVTFTDSSTELTGGAEYYYRVKAISSNDSAWSNEAFVFMPAYFLRAPTILSVSNTTSEKVTVKWKDNDNNYADFIIERKLPGQTFAQIGKTAAFTYIFTDTVHPSQTYTYRLKQDDNIYTSEYSDEAEITTKIITPPVPQNINGYYNGTDMIINWEYNSEADKFLIERRDSTIGNSFTQLALPSGSEREYTDVTTECQHIYVYRVKAIDKYSASSYSSDKVIKNWKTCP